MAEYPDVQDEKTRLKSSYNSAVSQLYRMDDLFKDTHKHSRGVNYASWNEDLDRIWVELIADSDDPEKLKMKEINQKIEGLHVYSNLALLKRKEPSLYSKIIFQQKSVLMEKEQLLREIMNAQGKGSKYEDSMDDYMD